MSKSAFASVLALVQHLKGVDCGSWAFGQGVLQGVQDCAACARRQGVLRGVQECRAPQGHRAVGPPRAALRRHRGVSAAAGQPVCPRRLQLLTHALFPPPLVAHCTATHSGSPYPKPLHRPLKGAA